MVQNELKEESVWHLTVYSQQRWFKNCKSLKMDEFQKYISQMHMRSYFLSVQTVRITRLLISIHPSYSRIQLTDEAITNPAEPPLFCMVLRKHLEGGTITSIEQYGTDRIITLDIRAKNEIGDDIQRKIYIEIMGRHSNLILVDPDTQNHHRQSEASPAFGE